eukprot:2958824-Alexandrium_andersonii.AAC.1
MRQRPWNRASPPVVIDSFHQCFRCPGDGAVPVVGPSGPWRARTCNYVCACVRAHVGERVPVGAVAGSH